MDARWQSFGSIRCGYTEFEGLKTSALGSAVVREVYVNSIAKHELTCPLCMSLEESHASICAAYCLHPLWFVDRKHTHTPDTFAHQLRPSLCCSPLTEGLVCEFTKKLCAAAAAALAHLPPYANPRSRHARHASPGPCALAPGSREDLGGGGDVSTPNVTGACWGETCGPTAAHRVHVPHVLA